MNKEVFVLSVIFCWMVGGSENELWKCLTENNPVCFSNCARLPPEGFGYWSDALLGLRINRGITYTSCE